MYGMIFFIIRIKKVESMSNLIQDSIVGYEEQLRSVTMQANELEKIRYQLAGAISALQTLQDVMKSDATTELPTEPLKETLPAETQPSLADTPKVD